MPKLASYFIVQHSQLTMYACYSYPHSACVSGSVRLLGGLVPTEGTVQMCVDGKWRELCYSDWGYQEAFVVCRQLGLPATGKTAATVLVVALIHNLFHNYKSIIYITAIIFSFLCFATAATGEITNTKKIVLKAVLILYYS